MLSTWSFWFFPEPSSLESAFSSLSERSSSSFWFSSSGFGYLATVLSYSITLFLKSTIFQPSSSSAISLNKSYWQFLRFNTILLFKAFRPSKLKGGHQGSDISCAASFSSLSFFFSVLSFRTFDANDEDPVSLDDDTFGFVVFMTFVSVMLSAPF